VCGNKFQSPFASPQGRGDCSAIINVVWGWFNFVIGGALIVHFFPPLPPPFGVCIAPAIGALAIGLSLASHFGKVRNSAPHP
jgi:hypothetical protein